MDVRIFAGDIGRAVMTDVVAVAPGLLVDGDAPADFAVNVEQRESAVLLFLFGRIIRDYPPSPAEGLTSNEISIALSLFRSVSAQPAAPDSLCVGYAPERRYLERRLQEIEKKWLDVCRIWGPPND